MLDKWQTPIYIVQEYQATPYPTNFYSKQISLRLRKTRKHGEYLNITSTSNFILVFLYLMYTTTIFRRAQPWPLTPAPFIWLSVNTVLGHERLIAGEGVFVN